MLVFFYKDSLKLYHIYDEIVYMIYGCLYIVYL